MQFIKMNVNTPLSYISSGQFLSDGEWCHVKRTIDSFVLLSGVEGKAYIQQEEEQYELTPGSTILLLPQKMHKGYRISNDKVSYYWCHFCCQVEYEVLDEDAFIREISAMEAGQYNYNCVILPLHQCFDFFERIQILFKQLIHTVNFNIHTKYQANFYLTSLSIEITEQTITGYFHSLNHDKTNSKIHSILEWIRINLDKEISVSNLAESYNYSKDYFTRIFKQKTGMSLLKYINHMKFLNAKDKLTHTNKSIKEIAYSLGFKDEKHFMKLFKKYENLTPTQYRNAFCYTHMNNK